MTTWKDAIAAGELSRTEGGALGAESLETVIRGDEESVMEGPRHIDLQGSPPVSREVIDRGDRTQLDENAATLLDTSAIGEEHFDADDEDNNTGIGDNEALSQADQSEFGQMYLEKMQYD